MTDLHLQSDATQPLPWAPPGRRRWLTVLFSAILLLCGGAIGSGVTVLIVLKQVQNRLHHPEKIPGEVAAHLRRLLGLSDEQTQRVETLLQARRAEIYKIRREFQPRLENQIDQAQREVAAVLTPPQAELWGKWVEDKRKAWLPPIPSTFEVPTTRPSRSIP